MTAWRREIALAAIIVAIALMVGARAPVFLTGGNLLDILDESSILAILVVGEMFVLITRGVDLSVAANLALTGMVCALAGKALPWLDTPALIGLALACGGALGAINGLLITRFGLPAIVVTLGTMSAYRGAIFVASHGAWVSDQDIHPAIKGFPREHLLGLSALVWTAALVLLAAAVFLRWRREGRELYALGGNLVASFYVGIPLRRRFMLAYTLSGMLAGLAGLLWVGRYSIAFTELASGYELTVIAACVIGGVGGVVGALLGVLFLGVVNGALPVARVSPFWQQAIAGAVILLSVVFNARAEKRAGRQILDLHAPSAGAAA
jgi:rhamnose transport system permease protein